MHESKTFSPTPETNKITNLKCSRHKAQHNRCTAKKDHTLCMFVDNVSLTMSFVGAGGVDTNRRHEDVYSVLSIECFDNMKMNLQTNREIIMETESDVFTSYSLIPSFEVFQNLLDLYLFLLQKYLLLLIRHKVWEILKQDGRVSEKGMLTRLKV